MIPPYPCDLILRDHRGVPYRVPYRVPGCEFVTWASMDMVRV